jgi:metal-responsive CopG/Arc/MetJ family transcriptional regulator
MKGGLKMARVQISMDDDVLQKVDDFAKKAALSRSAFLSMAAVDYIAAKEKAPLITSAFSSVAALLDARVKGEISQDEFQRRVDGLNQSIKSLKK